MATNDPTNIRITLALSRAAHKQLKGLAATKGVSMADIIREALRREVWLESVLNDEGAQLLIRNDGRPDELQRILMV